MKRVNSIKILFILVVTLPLIFQFIDVPKIVGARLLGDIRAQDSLGTNWTYQGYLTNNSNPADGSYDFRFILYNAEIGGGQIGDILYKNDVRVTHGVFTTILDFGIGIFDGRALYMEIAVRPSNSDNGAPYTTLSPRQAVTAVPYAIYARNAEKADLAERLTTGSNGLVKAAVLVLCQDEENTLIQRSMNTVGTQITVRYNPGDRDRKVPDSCLIDFGFNLRNRYWVMHDAAPLLEANPKCFGPHMFMGSEDEETLACGRFDLAHMGWGSNFFVIVY